MAFWLACELTMNSSCTNGLASNDVKMVKPWNWSACTYNCCSAQTAGLPCIDQGHRHLHNAEQGQKLLLIVCVFHIIETECQRRTHHLPNSLRLYLLQGHRSRINTCSEAAGLKICHLSAYQRDQLHTGFVLQRSCSQEVPP